MKIRYVREPTEKEIEAARKWSATSLRVLNLIKSNNVIDNKLLQKMTGYKLNTINAQISILRRMGLIENIKDVSSKMEPSLSDLDRPVKMVEEVPLQEDVIKVLERVKTIGATPRQIAVELKTSEELVSKELEELSTKARILRVGRNLWILRIYQSMIADPLFISPEIYLQKFERESELQLSSYRKGITFSENGGKMIHRWSPYVQGFSASFVDDMLIRYGIRMGQRVLDPFVGSGTVLVCAKMKGIDSLGVDLMPLMKFMSDVKTNWDLDVKSIKQFLEGFKSIENTEVSAYLPFLKDTNRQFNLKVLKNLLRLKQFIQEIEREDKDIGAFFKLAFASILVPCSNLKRSPCLGYVKDKQVPDNAPFIYFLKKVDDMLSDLCWVQRNIKEPGRVEPVIEKDARTVRYDENTIDIAITSPPYVNGLDYVINYKIEMAWLDLVRSYDDLRKLKDQMIVCDNVSRILVKQYFHSRCVYSDDWLDEICERIATRTSEKEGYRRKDMHLIVKKYFCDLYPVLKNVYDGLKDDGRFLIVVGDSLMAGVYVPADLIVARMGKSLDYEIEEVIVARQRRSGQRRDFKLRESIVVLRKGRLEKSPSNLLRYKALDQFFG